MYGDRFGFCEGMLVRWRGTGECRRRGSNEAEYWSYNVTHKT